MKFYGQLIYLQGLCNLKEKILLLGALFYQQREKASFSRQVKYLKDFKIWCKLGIQTLHVHQLSFTFVYVITQHNDGLSSVDSIPPLHQAIVKLYQNVHIIKPLVQLKRLALTDYDKAAKLKVLRDNTAISPIGLMLRNDKFSFRRVIHYLTACHLWLTFC